MGSSCAEGWELLKALGIPESLRVVKAVIAIEVDKAMKADITTIVGVDHDAKEVKTLTEEWRLAPVEKQYARITIPTEGIADIQEARRVHGLSAP